MKESRMGWKEKRRLYYARVIDLHVNHGMGSLKISRIVPVSRVSICKWIINFDANSGNQNLESMKQKSIEKVSSEAADNKSLQAKIASLESQLRKERLRADAYDTMIDIAEKKFNIPIRKKTGAKR